MQTIRELAQTLSVSKVSVMKEIDRKGLRSELQKVGNQFMIDDETADKIIQGFASRGKALSKSSLQSLSETANAEPQIDWQSEINAKNEQINAKDAQLAAKDEQIAALLAQIAAMQQAAAEQAIRHADDIMKLTEALSVAQRLHAGTLAERIETKDKEDPGEVVDAAEPKEEPKTEEPEARRKPWWQFWR